MGTVAQRLSWSWVRCCAAWDGPSTQEPPPSRSPWALGLCVQLHAHQGTGTQLNYKTATLCSADIQCSNLLLNMLIQFQLYPIVCKDCPSIHHPQGCSQPGHRRYLHNNSVIAGQFPVDVILKSIQGLHSELSGSATGELMRPGSAAIWNLGDKWINFALHL